VAKKGGRAPGTGVMGRHDVEVARIEERKAARVLDARYSLARTVVRSLTIAIACAFGYLSLRVIAGSTTTFSAVLKASFDLSIDRWAAYLLAGAGSAGWYSERRLRRKTIEKHAAYIKELEQKIDPVRSGSRLLPSGKPRKEDSDAP